jgi:hypothetical protein
MDSSPASLALGFGDFDEAAESVIPCEENSRFFKCLPNGGHAIYFAVFVSQGRICGWSFAIVKCGDVSSREDVCARE